MLGLTPIEHLFGEIVIVGFIAWLMMTYIPMEEPLKTIAKVALVIVAIYFLFKLLALV